jgi:hypothetical protein
VSLRRSAACYVIATGVAVLYYALVAQGVLATLSLAVPAAPGAPAQLVALTWVLIEIVVIALPFVALAIVTWSWPSLLPRSIWLAPLAVVMVPTAISGLWNLWALGTLRSDFAIGGELIPELTLAIELLGALLGSALVIMVQGRAGQSARPAQAPVPATSRALHRQG